MPNPNAQTALKILDYLKRNPEAEDTLEGIFNWWLPKQQIERNLERVQDALGELVSRNLVIMHNRQGIWTYRLNHNKEALVKMLIEWMGD